jgi:hypothetical protein
MGWLQAGGLKRLKSPHLKERCSFHEARLEMIPRNDARLFRIFQVSP